MTHAVVESPTTASPPWVLRHFRALLGLLLILRLLIDLRFPLAPDEAVYWSWSRHMAAGYFDHPPLIAWLNWLSTHVAGSTVLAVRLPPTLLALGTIAVISATARHVISDSRAVAAVVIMWLLSPLIAGLATISTPDTPAIFFSTCALACALMIARCDDRDEPASPWLWPLFGVFCGLALLSKYTTVLTPGAVCLAIFSSTRGRKHLLRPGVYLGALLALLIFSPVIWWNWRHGWASFLYQMHHGVSADEGPVKWWTIARNILLFIAGQAILWTPLLFAVGLGALWDGLKSWRRIAEVDWVLIWSAALPLLVFGWASSRKLGEMNWPAFTYVPLSLLTGRWLEKAGSVGPRWHWVSEGCKLALVFTVVIHLLFIPGVPTLLVKLRVPLPRGAREMMLGNRRAYGEALARAAEGAPVVCNRHQDAAEAAFYMPGQPDVWCDGVGSRPTAFDYFDNPPDFSRIGRVLFVGGHVPQFMAKHGYTQSRTVTIASGEGSHPTTAVMVTR
jgi:4-amino-4-deoxy-L-arabinose transferase-like glycosyltransferase